MRKRNVDVHIMLTEEERHTLEQTQKRTGLCLRELVMNAVSDKPFITTEYTEELRSTNEKLSKLFIELHKIGVNINQLSHNANLTGQLPTEYLLDDINTTLEIIGKECDVVWQFLRRSITGAGAGPTAL